MSIRPLTTVLLATTLTAPGCFFFGTSGSGKEASETREVDGFTELEVGGVFEVEAQIGPATSLEVTADDNILPLISTTVRGDRLVVEVDESIRPKVKPTLKITVPALAEVHASGATKINAQDLAGSFLLETSGAAKATLAGQVDELEIDVSGAAKIDAESLTARTAEVDVSGAAKVDVTVTETLDVDVSGAGKVTYGGNPTTVTKDVSGAGKVEPR